MFEKVKRVRERLKLILSEEELEWVRKVDLKVVDQKESDSD